MYRSPREKVDALAVQQPLSQEFIVVTAKLD